MPNYCENKVTVIGCKEDLDEIDDVNFSFQNLCPRPEEQEENWYNWNNINWGTKWDCWDYELKMKEENILVGSFRTAWCPPIAFLTSLLGKFPKAWIKCEFYTEDQMAGVWIGYMKDGSLVEKGSTWLEPMPVLDSNGEIYIPE